MLATALSVEQYLKQSQGGLDNMNKRDIKVGMRVRVKSWEKLLKGGFLKKEGYSEATIIFPSSTVIFTESMKDLCGQYATVKSIGESGRVVLDWDITPIIGWTIIPQMLELVEEKKEQVESKTFTKKDLKFGNVVELRSGSLCLIEPEFNLLLEHKNNSVTNPELSTRLRNIKTSIWETNLDKYNNNLKNNSYDKSDIMKVYEDYTLKNLLWERKEIKLSEREIEVLKALKTLGYRTIIRNEDKEYVHACMGKDHIEKGYCFWKGLGRIYDLLDETLFKFVKWEDEKPYSIEELLENETN